MLFNFDFVQFLFKTNGGRDKWSNFAIFVVWKALIVGGWVAVVQSRKFYLGPTIFLVLFKHGERRVDSRFRLLVFHVYQGNEEVR